MVDGPLAHTEALEGSCHALIYGRSYQSMVEEIELYLRDEVRTT